LHDLFKIGKDLAVKVAGARKEYGTQTDLGILEYERSFEVKINPINEDIFKANLPQIMKFINKNLGKYPEKDTKLFEEVFQDSEQILSSKNFPSDSLDNFDHFDIWDSCLNYFLNKHPESYETASQQIFIYLNVFSIFNI